ncbi:unnamed protein product [Meganyctiphanes norvegica]|uniref:Ribonuclease P/MRP protein subunit POP5 n=1 Tax=Meganyctiphanes norvegica TaxID=48144 RepID=A0AAV2QFR2_MEGNR
MVRVKRRYLVAEVVPENPQKFKFHNKGLFEAVKSSVRQLHGDFGEAAVSNGMQVKYLNPETHLAFVRVLRGPHQLAASALSVISSIDGQPATLRMLYPAATIRHALLFVKKHHEEKLRELEASLKSPQEKDAWTSRKQQLTSSQSPSSPSS